MRKFKEQLLICYPSTSLPLLLPYKYVNILVKLNWVKLKQNHRFLHLKFLAKGLEHFAPHPPQTAGVLWPVWSDTLHMSGTWFWKKKLLNVITVTRFEFF